MEPVFTYDQIGAFLIGTAFVGYSMFATWQMFRSQKRFNDRMDKERLDRENDADIKLRQIALQRSELERAEEHARHRDVIVHKHTNINV